MGPAWMGSEWSEGMERPVLFPIAVMIGDMAVLGVLVVAFATLVTAHVTLAIGLARRPPRWRAAIALLIAPLAPWWGWRERMHIRAFLWLVAAVSYAGALLAAAH